MPNERLTDTQRAQIALDRFEPLMVGKPEREIQELAEKWGRSRNAIAGAIRQAFERKLVEIRPTEDVARILAHLTRDNILEESLKEKFPPLIEAIVVKTTETSSDYIHRDIGYGLARQLRALIPDRKSVV